MLKFILFTLFSLQASAFAAICSCDAPPSCGNRPVSCHNSTGRLLIGNTYASKKGPNSQEINFHKVLRPGIMTVDFKRSSPIVGTYTAVMTSADSFNLMFKSRHKETSELVDRFKFSVDIYNEVPILESSNGTAFFLLN